MLLNCGGGEDSWESLGLQGDQTSQSWRKSVLNIHWKDWRWGWNSNTLATWSEELTHLKRPWCWESLKVGEEGDDRWWDGWMVSPTRRLWVWVSSGSWWWTGKPGVLQSLGLPRVGHGWVNWLIDNALACVTENKVPEAGECHSLLIFFIVISFSQYCASDPRNINIHWTDKQVNECKGRRYK